MAGSACRNNPTEAIASAERGVGLHVFVRFAEVWQNLIDGLSKMWQYCKKMFVPLFVYALRAIAYRGGSFSIDMNALRAIAGTYFREITSLSRRETISIKRIRRINCVVRRTFTTKPERKFLNNDPQFFTLHPAGLAEGNPLNFKP